MPSTTCRNSTHTRHPTSLLAPASQSHKRTLPTPSNLPKSIKSPKIVARKPNASSTSHPEVGSPHSVRTSNPVPPSDSISTHPSPFADRSLTRFPQRNPHHATLPTRPPATPTKYGPSRPQPHSPARTARSPQIVQTVTFPLSRLYAPFPWNTSRLMDTYSFQSVKAPR